MLNVTNDKLKFCIERIYSSFGPDEDGIVKITSTESALCCESLKVLKVFQVLKVFKVL